MGNEYNEDGKIILRDTSGNQMSLPRFFQLALVAESGHYARPTSHHHSDAWDMGTGGATDVPARTPVFGTVTSCAQTGDNGGRGTYVTIEDEKGRQHEFFHMIANSLTVSSGDSVNQGDKLGLIGNTGDSAGEHLHYDVKEGGVRLADPMDAFDCTTLPSGWNFAAAVDNGNNWDYIELDRTATDFGPPGGETPSEPFFTDSPCYDISHPQGGNAINPIIQSNAGGVIIGVGRFGWRDNQGHQGSDGYTEQTSWATDIAAAKGNIPFGLYFYSYVKASEYEQYGFDQGLTSLQNAGIEPKDVSMGIWIDIEDADSVTSDKTRNFALVQKFCKVFTDAGYPLVGLYSAASPLRNWYNQSDLAEFPLWAAAIGGGNIPFENATRDNPNLTSNLPENEYKNIYIYQYSWVQRVPGYGSDLDGDRVLLPMPVVGSGGGGGGGGEGGSYTEVIKVTVDVIPPKRIYFSPVPGIIPTSDTRLDEREQKITITTDADNVNLYYTLDGSSPYQYTTNNGTTAYTVAANALLYSSSITINKDTHIRVIAVPSGTSPGMTFDEPLAKGSGTFLFQYQSIAQTWEEEQKSYATSDGAVSFFEENKQAFLRLHAEQTEEEILYTEVYRHDTQVAESDASDSASKTEEGGQPTYDGSDEPTDTTEEGDADVSDE